MPRAPGPAIFAVVLVAAVGTVVLVRYQGLDRANLWAGVLALFLAIVAVVAQLWSTWSGAAAPTRPDAEPPPGSGAGPKPPPLSTGAGPEPPPRPDAGTTPPGAVGRPRRLLGVGRWSTRAVVAAVAAATVAFVLVIVNLPPAGPAVPGVPGWVRVGSGENVTLTDHATFDFERGALGGEYAVGADIFLSQRADRLSAAESGDLAVLDAATEPSVRRCLDATTWDGTVNGLHDLPTGTSICVRTGDRRCAILTIDAPPDVVVNVLTFHYTLWERR